MHHRRLRAIIPAQSYGIGTVSTPTFEHVVAPAEAHRVSHPGCRGNFADYIAAVVCCAILIAKQQGVILAPEIPHRLEVQPTAAPFRPLGWLRAWRCNSHGVANATKYMRPVHQVTVKPFFMDVTEVTNEEYAKFVAANPTRRPSDLGEPYLSCGRRPQAGPLE